MGALAGQGSDEQRAEWLPKARGLICVYVCIYIHMHTCVCVWCVCSGLWLGLIDVVVYGGGGFVAGWPAWVPFSSARVCVRE
jgi:hypothetical protein